jgi:hypothetical protein
MTTLTRVNWDSRTVATVLAALRYWQGALQADGDREMSTKAKARAIDPDHFAEAQPLDLTELDALCEAINFDDLRPPERKWSAERIKDWVKAHKTTSYNLTWGQLEAFINEAGFANDEYFHLTAPYDLFETGRKEAFLRQRVWEQAHWMGVFWVVGGSEGFYVHVERMWYEEDPSHRADPAPPLKRDLVFVGKFWDWRRAEEAVNAVQYLLNVVW